MFRAKLLVLLLIAMAWPAAAQESHVTTVEQVAFHSDFWVNLHKTLYVDARATLPREVLAAMGRQARMRAMPTAPLSEQLDGEQRDAWLAAVAFYQESLAQRDLRTGDDMTEIQWTLSDSGAALLEGAEITAEHRRHLLATAPIYREQWWAEHDRAIRAWIEDVAERIATVGPDVRERLTPLLETSWFDEPYRADITYYGRAFTTVNPRPHTFIAILDENYAEWAGAEMIFHEASHALTDPMEERIDREAERQGKTIRDLWHPSMFYLVGELWRSELEERDIEYVPYVYANGLFDRAWSSSRAAIEEYLGALTRGEMTVEEAYRGLVGALSP